MLMGIQVKLLMAPQKLLRFPASSTPPGETMKVTHELATTRIAVPMRFDSTPSDTWIHFRGPESQSQP